MQIISQGKTNYIFLLIIFAVAAAAGSLLWWMSMPEKEYADVVPVDKITEMCDDGSSCINTFCGCIKDNQDCDIEFFKSDLKKRDCICADNKCIDKSTGEEGEPVKYILDALTPISSASGWELYINNEYGFAIEHPKNLTFMDPRKNSYFDLEIGTEPESLHSKEESAKIIISFSIYSFSKDSYEDYWRVTNELQKNEGDMGDPPLGIWADPLILSRELGADCDSSEIGYGTYECKVIEVNGQKFLRFLESNIWTDSVNIHYQIADIETNRWFDLILVVDTAKDSNFNNPQIEKDDLAVLIAKILNNKTPEGEVENIIHQRILEFNTMVSTFQLLSEEALAEKEIEKKKDECGENEDPVACYTELAKELKDPLICEDQNYKHPSDCYKEVLDFFVSLRDFQLCGKLPYDYHVYDCRLQIVELMEDFSACNKFEEQPYRNSCLITYAYKFKEPLACNSLTPIKQNDLTDRDYFINLGYDNFSPEDDLISPDKEDCLRAAREPEPWQVYQDKEYGWEISCPRDFAVGISSYSGDIYFTSPEDIMESYSPFESLKYHPGFMWVEVEELAEAETFEEWVLDFYDSSLGINKENFEKLFPSGEFRDSSEWPEGVAPFGSSIKRATVGENIQAIESRGPIWQVDEYKAYHIEHNNTVITIITTGVGGGFDTPLFDQVLSTFKFSE